MFINDHMVGFLFRHALLNTSQHAFLKARLCLLEEIIKWVDEGSPVDLIYFNFQNIFRQNAISYYLLRLLPKLKAHGIGDGMREWIEEWLTVRIQCSRYCSKRKGLWSNNKC